MYGAPGQSGSRIEKSGERSGRRRGYYPSGGFEEVFCSSICAANYPAGWRECGSRGLVSDYLAGSGTGNGLLGGGSDARGERTDLEIR